jgi:hypothetical protein
VSNLVEKPGKWALIVGLSLALFIGQTWFTYRGFTSRFPGGNDFAARWYNGCALIWTGENPYSDQVTLQTQMQMYGRPALPGEDLVAFSYPIYALFFFWPLCYLQPYALVQAVWMTLMFYSVVAGAFLMMRVSRLQLSGALLPLTVTWAVLNYPEARAILLGQMVVVVFLAVSLALLALSRQADILAGVLLAVATIKPQVVFLLVLWLLWWSGWRRRWRLWWSFGTTLILMVAGGLLLVPSWPADFARHIRDYADVTISPYYSLTWMTVQHYLSLGPVVEAAVTALIALYLGYEWWRCRQAVGEAMVWITGLTLNLTQFIAVQIATTSYILLLLPIFQLFSLVRKEMPARAGWLILSAQSVFLVGQWAIFLTTVEGNFETAPAYFLLPFSLLLFQLLARSRLVRGCRQWT